MGEYDGQIIFLTIAFGAIIALIYAIFGKKSQDCQEEVEVKITKPMKLPKNVNHVKKKLNSSWFNKISKTIFSHKWLIGTLKGHGGAVCDVDFSSNGKYVVSCGEDQAIFMWSTKDFLKKERKCIRGTVDYDHASCIKFTPDSRAFVTCVVGGNHLKIFRLGKKDDGSSITIRAAQDFKKNHDVEITYIDVSSNGKFILTCYKDSILKLWDIKGEVLATIDTLLLQNSFAKISPCGRFVAASGFTSDVKVWSVLFGKDNQFQEVKRAYELKGHRAGIYSFDFSNDSYRMASISKDGTWKFWNTNVEYNLGQDPGLLQTGTFEHDGPAKMSMSPDGRVVAISVSSEVYLYSTKTASLLQKMENVFSSMSVIKFDHTGKFLAVAGEKHVHIFHNVPGYEMSLSELNRQHEDAVSASLRERLSVQINALKKVLGGIAANDKN